MGKKGFAPLGMEEGREIVLCEWCLFNQRNGNLPGLQRGKDQWLQPYAAPVQGRLWEVAVDPREEGSYKSKLFVTASKAQRGLVYLRYVADEKQIPGSVAVKASIEDAYIYKLGGMKR